MALGSCSPVCMSVLLEEMQGMSEDPSAERAKVSIQQIICLPLCHAWFPKKGHAL